MCSPEALLARVAARWAESWPDQDSKPLQGFLSAISGKHAGAAPMPGIKLEPGSAPGIKQEPEDAPPSPSPEPEEGDCAPPTTPAKGAGAGEGEGADEEDEGEGEPELLCGWHGQPELGARAVRMALPPLLPPPGIEALAAALNPPASDSDDDTPEAQAAEAARAEAEAAETAARMARAARRNERKVLQNEALRDGVAGVPVMPASAIKELVDGFNSTIRGGDAFEFFTTTIRTKFKLNPVSNRARLYCFTCGRKPDAGELCGDFNHRFTTHPDYDRLCNHCFTAALFYAAPRGGWPGVSEATVQVVASGQALLELIDQAEAADLPVDAQDSLLQRLVNAHEVNYAFSCLVDEDEPAAWVRLGELHLPADAPPWDAATHQQLQDFICEQGFSGGDALVRARRSARRNGPSEVDPVQLAKAAASFNDAAAWDDALDSSAAFCFHGVLVGAPLNVVEPTALAPPATPAKKAGKAAGKAGAKAGAKAGSKRGRAAAAEASDDDEGEAGRGKSSKAAKAAGGRQAVGKARGRGKAAPECASCDCTVDAAAGQPSVSAAGGIKLCGVCAAVMLDAAGCM